ncbi:MAG: adenosylcobinamide-GDP ribazoletransferase [Candidatus Bathyarchaeota archaeon]|nr:MAG: adenosylcobinamide-GDP ribazoletransferase [Candidatus Bathyarchaeota archaeon]
MNASKAIRSLISFLTTIPVGMPDDALDQTATNMHLFPIVGAFIGLLTGIPAYLLFLAFPEDLAGILSYGLLQSITGLQHLDGLFDLGDGLMTHSTPKRKIEAMKDPNLGVGGISIGVFFSALTVVLMSKLKIGILIPSLIVCEMISKLSMVLLAWLGKSASTGMATRFIDEMQGKTRRFSFSLAFTLFTAWIVLGWKGIGSVAACIVGDLVLLEIARRNFEGLTGDVFGASNEISRAIALFLIVGVGN